jgi:hypothetical protein
LALYRFFSTLSARSRLNASLRIMFKLSDITSEVRKEK